MTLWAIVPVKPLRRGKSRLAQILTDEERSALNQCLLENTLDTLQHVPEIEHVLVISRDPAALAIARLHGARSVLEHGTPQLNIALSRATIIAHQHAISGVLIIPADLPFLSVQDIQHLLRLQGEPPVVVIAPDRHQQGTNAMLVSPIGLIPYAYGPSSFQNHCEYALQAGARLEVLQLPSLALDLDLPDDLELVHQEFDSLSELFFERQAR
jgi:2-phospho-L-lactate guanylyltransferase